MVMRDGRGEAPMWAFRDAWEAADDTGGLMLDTGAEVYTGPVIDRAGDGLSMLGDGLAAVLPAVGPEPEVDDGDGGGGVDGLATVRRIRGRFFPDSDEAEAG